MIGIIRKVTITKPKTRLIINERMVAIMKKEICDYTYLAEGVKFPVDSLKTNINLNEVVIASTGAGKTMSIALPKLLHTHNASVVVPLTKRSLKENAMKMFKDRGYMVLDMDLARPENCLMGYNPLDYIKRDEDVLCLAKHIVEINVKESKSSEPYWDESAEQVIAAIIHLVRLNAKDAGKRVTIKDVMNLYRSLEVDYSGGTIHTNLDNLFYQSNMAHPHNPAYEAWKTVRGLAVRTASCIFSIATAALNSVFSDSVSEITAKKNSISFKDLGRQKTALFITTSPMNKSLQPFINLLYADMFRDLFEEAERRNSCSLKVPVRVICDDFATGGKIPDFEDYISIFRAAGISVTLLLQSESQLINMYEQHGATTILDNCDTCVYMGSNDIKSVENIAKWIDKPNSYVMNLPLDMVIVRRRGYKPIIARRYQTLDDPIYKKYFTKETETEPMDL